MQTEHSCLSGSPLDRLRGAIKLATYNDVARRPRANNIHQKPSFKHRRRSMSHRSAILRVSLAWIYQIGVHRTFFAYGVLKGRCGSKVYHNIVCGDFHWKVVAFAEKLGCDGCGVCHVGESVASVERQRAS